MGGYPGFPSFQGADTSKTKSTGSPLSTAKPYGSTPLENDKFSRYNLNDFTKKFYDTTNVLNPAGGYNIYVPNANQVTNAASVSANTDLYRKISMSLFSYNDKNRNDRYDKDADEFVGKFLDLRIFISVDGAWLLETAKLLEPTLQSNQLVIFLEVSDDDHQDEFSDRLLLCYGGSAASAYFNNKALAEAIGQYITLSKEQLENLIKNCADKYAIVTALRGIVSGTAVIAKWLPEKTGDLLCGIGSVLEHMKASKSVWDADLHVSFSKLFREMLADWKNIQKNIFPTELMNMMDAEVNKKIKSISYDEAAFLQMLTKPLTVFNDALLYLLDNVSNVVLRVGQAIFALLCGIYNGILDMIGGLCTFFGWIFRFLDKATGAAGAALENADYYIPLLLELLDNATQAMQRIDWNVVLDAVCEGFQKLWDAIDFEKMLPDLDFSVNEICYYSGYVAINILACFVGVGEIANLTRVSKLSPVLEKIINYVAVFVDRLPVIAKVTIEGLYAIIKGYIKLLMEGTKSIVAIINKIFEALLKYVLSLAKGGVQLVEAWLKTAAGIELKEGLGQISARFLPKTEDLIHELIAKFESSIVDDEIESMCFFDEAGNQLSKIISSGKEAQILFKKLDVLKARSEMAKLGKRIYDIILTHNHPGGSALSAADIEMMLEFHIKELRAVGKARDGAQIVYSIRRNGEVMGQSLLTEKLDVISRQLVKEFPMLKTDGMRKGSLQYQMRKADLLLEEFKDYVNYIVYK